MLMNSPAVCNNNYQLIKVVTWYHVEEAPVFPSKLMLKSL